MILAGLARIGRDAELRYVPSGEAVINLSLAFNYGSKDSATGNRPTQWIEGVIWGKRAEALAPHLLKGMPVYVAVQDPHLEEYTGGKSGGGVKMTGRVIEIEFAGTRGDRSGEQQPRAQQSTTKQSAPQQRPPASHGGGFADFDDDIPFAPLAARRAALAV